MNRTAPAKFIQSGFTLVELTMVLIIVALLSTGLLFGVSAQRSVAENADAQRQLENIRETLLGFAIAKSRLPCPARASIPSGTVGAGEEDCSITNGVIPWVTLGITETDPWGNRITYYSDQCFSCDSICNRNVACNPSPPLSSTSTPFTLDTDGNANIKEASSSGSNVASKVPSVIVSHGKRSLGAWQPTGNQIPGASGDEAENSDTTNAVFVSKVTGEDFDDLVTWIVPSILKSRMVAAGRLP